ASAQTRICTYNVLNFPGSTGPERIPHFQTVLNEIQPDLLVCQEMLDNSGAQQFFEGVLDTSVFDRAGWVTQGLSEYMLYYKQDLFELVDIHTILTDLRNWEIYELSYLGGGARPNLFIATSHLKASQGADNEYRRLIECEALLDWLVINPVAGNNLLLCGDFNFYYSNEPGYQALLADSQFVDPIDTPGYWHDSSIYAAVHTQSPRVTQFGGGATGGMDDRFDFALVTPQLIDGADWEYVAGSYTSFGNDGQHFNQAINNPPNQIVPQDVADALHDATDHLPVYLDITYVEASPLQIALTPVNPPVQIPASGGNLIFDLFVENVSLSPQDYDAWLEIAYESGSPSTVVMRAFTNYQPGWTIDRPGMWYPISSTYAAGDYTFTGKVGEHPSYAWDQDGFPFVKLGGDFAADFVPFPVHGAPNPFEAAFDRGIMIPETPEVLVYPNPFNPTTTISFNLAVKQHIDLDIYDVSGRRVAELVEGWRDAGSHAVTFDGSNLASGIYLYRMVAGHLSTTGKLVLMK
ncbi:T9SS type A sorting domain-containing protein, partial [bacterium]|nr:T9SS type A sorting domain-containing protein [bacterium]